MIHYYQLREPGDIRRVYLVPGGEAVTAKYVKQYGTELALRYAGVWQLAGLAVVRDPRYVAILEATPVLEA
jgi:hypothetical protein